MLKVESIQNGIVIDHITAGKGMGIYRLLDLEASGQSVALLQNVKSRKYGTKEVHPVPPKELKNVIRCQNPRCITIIETDCDHIFRMSSSGKYRCIYCNQEIHMKSQSYTDKSAMVRR